MASAVTSTDPLLDEDVDCAACGTVRPLRGWMADAACPDCGEPHVVPRLPTALEAIERGDYESRRFGRAVAEYGLGVDGAVDLMLALGCDPAAALDVGRVVVDGRPRSEWRRWIGETREEEARHIEAAEEVLGEHGVVLDYPDE